MLEPFFFELKKHKKRPSSYTQNVSIWYFNFQLQQISGDQQQPSLPQQQAHQPVKFNNFFAQKKKSNHTVTFELNSNFQKNEKKT